MGSFAEAQSDSEDARPTFDNPSTLTGPRVVTTRPEFSWERIKYNVNEDPAVIGYGDRHFLTYSASATNDD